MDYGLMEDVLKGLRGFNLPDKDRERVSRIEKMLTELDWEGMTQVAQEGI